MLLFGLELRGYSLPGVKVLPSGHRPVQHPVEGEAQGLLQAELAVPLQQLPSRWSLRRPHDSLPSPPRCCAVTSRLTPCSSRSQLLSSLRLRSPWTPTM